MKNIVYGGCIALAIVAGASAQDKGAMGTDHSGHMAAMQTYSGCLERTDDGMFVLTHVTSPKDKGKMSHSMKAEGMKADGMRADGMKPAMASDTLHVSSTSVDFASHVGQKVSLGGSRGDMNGMAGLSVTSLKVAAKSCR
jgi:hypothetical protein